MLQSYVLTVIGGFQVKFFWWDAILLVVAIEEIS